MARSPGRNTVLTDMEQHHRIASLRGSIHAARKDGRSIAVVPTMGNLHEGHLSLIRLAADRADFVVCTLFVNPMQFGAHEDLDSYPRTPDEDREKLLQAGCHCVFAPPVNEIYPEGLEQHTRVSIPDLSELHCGAGRPGHFDGVATVVAKLFHIVQPDIAVFGQKDFQQLQVIRKMTRDLCLPVEVLSAPTRREPDGLAMSSRNGYLSADERSRAPVIYRALQNCASRLQAAGMEQMAELEADARREISDGGLDPEYVVICDQRTLRPPTADARDLVILAAARLGSTRLIDNITLQR